MNVDTVEEFWSWEQIRESSMKASSTSLEAFRNSFGEFIGADAEQVYLTPSGHQGLEWLLRARLDSRRGVMVPAFNCSVVQDAVAAAGFRSRLYDFSPSPGIFDWQRVIDEMHPDVGVLIVTHYFGVPVDFRSVLNHCRSQGIAVIEDCAHTLGGTIGNQQVGTLGDAAIFSFNYDKPISLGWGGVAVINNSIAFDGALPTDYEVPRVQEEMALFRQFVSAMTERRRMIPYQHLFATRVLRRLSIIRSGSFSKSHIIGIGAVQSELGCWCLSQYRCVLRARKNNAEALASHIPWQTWPVDNAVEPAWVKQKVHIPYERSRRTLSSRLQRKGIRAGNFNWPTLIDGQGRADCPQALDAATNWIDVPVHQNQTDACMAELIDAFKENGRDAVSSNKHYSR